MFGKPFGIRIAYDWNPKRCILFWVGILILIFTWVNIFYTQYVHVKNQDYMKVIEVFTVYGITSSVAYIILFSQSNKSVNVNLF